MLRVSKVSRHFCPQSSQLLSVYLDVDRELLEIIVESGCSMLQQLAGVLLVLTDVESVVHPEFVQLETLLGEHYLHGLSLILDGRGGD